MPAQPLSSVAPKAKINLTGYAVNDRPTLAFLLAKSIAVWANIEVHLGIFLAKLLGGDGLAAVAMYQSMDTFRAQSQLLDAAARTELDAKDYDLFCAVLQIIRRVAKKRNSIAHQTWAMSEDLPDALLMVNVKSLINLEALTAKFYAENSSENVKSKPKPVLQLNEIFVWREIEFNELLAQLLEAENYILHFILYLNTEGDVQKRHLDKLLKTKDIQNELARISKDRQP